MSKGYFFTLDAFIAVGVIIIGILIVMSYSPSSPDTGQLSEFAYNTIDVFTLTHLSEYDNDYVRHLAQTHQIKNLDNTLLEQIGEFYYRGETTLMHNYIENLTLHLIPPEYGIGFYVDEQPQYERQSAMGRDSQIISAKINTVGLYNSTTLWGPYLLEVRLWQ